MASFSVDPSAFNTAAEYSNFVDQYNAGTPQERYELAKSNGFIDDTFDAFLAKSGGVENNFNNKLGSYGDDKGFLGLKWGEFGDWFDNLFTGNRDYSRSLYVKGLEQRFNAAESQKQRDYEERLANTAYQRAAADASAAGFNPALIMLQGGAATPVGTAARDSGGSYSSKSGAGGLKLVSALLGSFMTAMSLMAKSSIAGAVEAGANTIASRVNSVNSLDESAVVKSMADQLNHADMERQRIRDIENLRNGKFNEWK